MNSDQAFKCTCISITIRCQPYVWHHVQIGQARDGEHAKTFKARRQTART